MRLAPIGYTRSYNSSPAQSFWLVPEFDVQVCVQSDFNSVRLRQQGYVRVGIGNLEDQQMTLCYRESRSERLINLLLRDDDVIPPTMEIQQHSREHENESAKLRR